MAKNNRSEVVEVLASAMPEQWLEQQATDVQALQRMRKVDIVAFVHVLVMGFPPGQRRTLRGLRRMLELATGVELADSSFHERFTPAMTTLLRLLVHRLIDRLAKATAADLQCAIEGVCDILATDATIFGDNKLHAVTNVLGTSANRVKLTDKDTHDSQLWKRIGSWVKGHLLLFDLGYYDFHLFWRIQNQGGFFLSRAKTNFNPTIISSHRTHRGRAIKVEGERLQDVLPRFKRKMFDLVVEVAVKKRVYRGKCSTVKFKMRLVGLWNDELGRYHMYLTNLGPDELEAELVGEVYRLRWQVELMWMGLKTEGRLGQMPTNKPVILQALMWASIAYMLCTRVLLEWLRDRIEGDVWVSTRLFERVFEPIRLLLLFQVLEHRYRGSSDDPLLDYLLFEVRSCAQPPSTPFTTAFDL